VQARFLPTVPATSAEQWQAESRGAQQPIFCEIPVLVRAPCRRLAQDPSGIGPVWVTVQELETALVSAIGQQPATAL